MNFANHVFAVFIGLSELILRPPSARANTTDRVNFAIEPVVLARLVSEGLGEQTYRVVSNVPFAVNVSNYVGSIQTSIGDIGPLAQLPGPKETCGKALGLIPITIYQATRRTAARAGHSTSQSILVTFNFSERASPQVDFVPVLTSENDSHIPQLC